MIAAVRRFALAALVLAAPALAAAQTYTISPPPFLLAQNNSGAIINNACIWTYTAGTTTPATTYTTSTGTANSNPIRSDSAGRFTAYLQPGVSYKFVYESACTPPAHGTTLRTADNIAAVPTSASTVDDTIAVAGEAISAGQCVYLSDGSGGKTQGQWYRCDAANTYSSTGNDVGLATAAISAAATGTVRRAGLVTGLSLSAGAMYYAGTAGAITSTPPTNARKIGQAETATTLLVGDPPGIPAGGSIGQVWVSGGTSTPALFQATGFVNDFRLSLTTATCETTTDVTAATTLFLTPCTGNRITLFDTSGNPETCSTAEISIAVPATTSQLYDVWAYDSTFGTCAVTLELLATSRTDMTGLTRVNGRWTKTANSSRMYVGMFRTTTVSGQTEDSLTKRYVWNVYNQKRRPLLRQESTAAWNYSTQTLRQANGSTANQVDVVVGLAEATLSLDLRVMESNNAQQSTSGGYVCIGEDSTTVCVAGQNFMVGAILVASAYVTTTATLTKKPAVGRHVYAWEEYAAAAGTNSWYGVQANLAQSGLSGWIEG